MYNFIIYYFQYKCHSFEPLTNNLYEALVESFKFNKIIKINQNNYFSILSLIKVFNKYFTFCVELMCTNESGAIYKINSDNTIPISTNYT